MNRRENDTHYPLHSSFLRLSETRSCTRKNSRLPFDT
jgi:hypothetical protein